MFVSSISKDQLRELPAAQFKGTIHLIDNRDKLKEACDALNKQTLLGFDTETKPNFKKGMLNKVSLLQLSTYSDAYLIRLNRTGLPEELTRILANPAIRKVGLAIRDDIRLLNQLCPFQDDGFLELQHYVKQFGIENSGLSKIAGIVLNARISKSQQLSNWENDQLSEGQQIYAATDAWAALQIFTVLASVRLPGD